jgi:hypothetical protein
MYCSEIHAAVPDGQAVAPAWGTLAGVAHAASNIVIQAARSRPAPVEYWLNNLDAAFPGAGINIRGAVSRNCRLDGRQLEFVVEPSLENDGSTSVNAVAVSLIEQTNDGSLRVLGSVMSTHRGVYVTHCWPGLGLFVSQSYLPTGRLDTPLEAVNVDEAWSGSLQLMVPSRFVLDYEMRGRLTLAAHWYGSAENEVWPITQLESALCMPRRGMLLPTDHLHLSSTAPVLAMLAMADFAFLSLEPETLWQEVPPALDQIGFMTTIVAVPRIHADTFRQLVSADQF